jgi:hypothetical protein
MAGRGRRNCSDASSPRRRAPISAATYEEQDRDDDEDDHEDRSYNTDAKAVTTPTALANVKVVSFVTSC